MAPNAGQKWKSWATDSLLHISTILYLHWLSSDNKYMSSSCYSSKKVLTTNGVSCAPQWKLFLASLSSHLFDEQTANIGKDVQSRLSSAADRILDGIQRCKRLRWMPIEISQKALVIQSSIWPAALHGADSQYLGKKRLIYEERQRDLW